MGVSLLVGIPKMAQSPSRVQSVSRSWAESRRGVQATTRDHTFPLLSDAGSATIKRYGILYMVAEEARGPNRDRPVVKSDIQKYVSPLHRTQRPERPACFG